MRMACKHGLNTLENAKSTHPLLNLIAFEDFSKLGAALNQYLVCPQN